MNDRASLPQSNPTDGFRRIARQTFLAWGGGLALMGLLLGLDDGPGYALLGGLLIVALCAAVGLVATLIYGIAKRAVWAALFGAVLGAVIGGFVGALLVMELPGYKRSLTASSHDGDDTATANISAYNHTDDYIHQFYINGQGGANSYAHGGGGSFVCCLVYPRTWQPGLTAKVRWTTSTSDPNGSPEVAWHGKVVPIERYEKTGTTVNVHFLPKGEVRLIITNMSAGALGYPGPDAPEIPTDWPYGR